MSSNCNDVMELLVCFMLGDVCLYEIQLQWVIVLFGVVVFCMFGGLIVICEEFEQIGGKFIGIEQDYVFGEICIIVGELFVEIFQFIYFVLVSCQ